MIPDHISSQNKRKDESEQQFYTTIKWLMAWWHEYFKVMAPGMVTRPLESFASIPVLDPHGDFMQVILIIKNDDRVLCVHHHKIMSNSSLTQSLIGTGNTCTASRHSRLGKDSRSNSFCELPYRKKRHS